MRTALNSLMRLLPTAIVVTALATAAAAATSPPGSAGAKQASKCQQTIGKANAKFLAQRLKRLAACSTDVLGCLQTAGADAKCLLKASTKCQKQLGVPNQPDPLGDTLEAAIIKACGPPMSAADLLDPTVLGFTNAEAVCAAVAVKPLESASDVGHCLRRVHANLSERVFGLEVPRAAELVLQGGIDATLVPDLPVFGGCGTCSTLPLPLGKAVASCAAAVGKAAGGFVAGTRAGLDKCTSAFVKCAQEKASDPGCLSKAAATCRKIPAALVKARAKLQPSLQKKCGGTALFDALEAQSGINLGALTCACQQVGVSTVANLDDYAACVGRHHECELAALLPTVAPGLDGLLAAQGIAVSDLLCAPPSASVVSARGVTRTFTSPFGTITKFMKGVFPGKLVATSSPLATRGTPPRVGAPSFGTCTPAPGRSCSLFLPIRKAPFALQRAARGGGPPPTLLVGVRRLDGEFVDDHFELELGDTSIDSEVELQVTYADDLASCGFELALSVMEGGEVASYTAVEQQPHVPPGNDECSAARPIEGRSFIDVLDTTAATVSEGEQAPSCAQSAVGRVVWYSFTPSNAGIMTVSTLGSDYDTVLAVSSGACGGSELACVADVGTPQAVLSLPVAADTTYFIQVAERGDPKPTSTLHFGLFFIPLGNPPVLAKGKLGNPDINSANCSSINGSAFPIGFDYSDEAGNVLPGQTFLSVTTHFEPSGNENSFPLQPVITGDGFHGHIDFIVCAFFGTDSSVSFQVNLIDVSGVSDELVLATPRPPGAN